MRYEQVGRRANGLKTYGGRYITERLHSATEATDCLRSIVISLASPTIRNSPGAATLPCVGTFITTPDVLVGTSTSSVN